MRLFERNMARRLAIAPRNSAVTPLKLDVFGRMLLIERYADGWAVFYLGSEGKRRPAEDIFIPSTVPEGELERFVADLCHEWATSRNPSVVRIR